MTVRHTLRRNRVGILALVALAATALILLGTGLATWNLTLH